LPFFGPPTSLLIAHVAMSYAPSSRLADGPNPKQRYHPFYP
jgi:hypothetical protein